MSKDQERLALAIKDAEARMRVFTSTLESIAKELRDLRAVQFALEENITSLKTKKIVTMALEFRKAREYLNKTKAKTAIVTNDYEKIDRAAKEVEEYLRKAKEELANTLKEPSNILAFRRKNAKE